MILRIAMAQERPKKIATYERIVAKGFLISVATPRSDPHLDKLEVCSDQCEIVLGRRERTARIDERIGERRLRDVARKQLLTRNASKKSDPHIVEIDMCDT